MIPWLIVFDVFFKVCCIVFFIDVSLWIHKRH